MFIPEIPEEFEKRLRNFLLERFGLSPEDMDPFITAFTHSSFKTRKNKVDYEKLELLGDSCIELIITSHLYSLNISLKDMCNLRKEIVQSSSLSYVSEKIGLNEYLRVGKSCQKITRSMLEDIYESFIGSVFFSFGFEEARRIVDETLWMSFVNRELVFAIDYKTKLQELVQERIKKDILYTLDRTVLLEEGEQIFFVSLFIGGELKGTGEGMRLKDAEQLAAKKALMEFR